MESINATERGNNAFSNSEGASVIFVGLTIKGHYLQSAYTPCNYPAFDVSTVYMYGEKLRDHIMYNLAGWYVHKCQLDVNIDDDGYVIDAENVIEEVAEHVVKMALKNDCDPTQTGDMLDDAIQDSANVLHYVVTLKMIEDCRPLVIEDME